MSETMIKKFENLYEGQAMWIVGKGPSLQYLTKEDIGSGPVITLNEAIIKIEEIDLPNPIFSMQKDGGSRKRYPGQSNPDCDYISKCDDKCDDMIRPKKGATLLVHNQESLYCFFDYSPRYVFDLTELGLLRNNISLIVAIKIGILMGCEKIRFISCDVHVNGCKEEYIPNVGVVGINHKYIRHKRRIKPYLIDLDCKWITPKKNDARKT